MAKSNILKCCNFYNIKAGGGGSADHSRRSAIQYHFPWGSLVGVLPRWMPWLNGTSRLQSRRQRTKKKIKHWVDLYVLGFQWDVVAYSGDN